ncbi:MAG: hypothetical protein F7C34_03450 [Desulfurococcales archaeon]|nr:hypothetical protein [Desulfurococcales archaeon]
MPVVACNTRAIARLILSGSQRKSRRSRGLKVRLGGSLPDKCLICQGSILAGGRVVMCPYCGSMYHLECLRAAAESSGMPLEEAVCFFCGRKMPVAEVLRLAEVRA